MPAEISIKEFIRDGYVNEYWYNGSEFEQRKNDKTGDRNDEFTRAIIIPITDEQGDRIRNAAQDLLYESGVYNMWTNNCLQVTNRLIGEGGEELLLGQNISWISEHYYNGTIYADAAFGSTLIPNQDFILASRAASYLGYEQIKLGEGCIDDK